MTLSQASGAYCYASHEEDGIPGMPGGAITPVEGAGQAPPPNSTHQHLGKQNTSKRQSFAQRFKFSSLSSNIAGLVNFEAIRIPYY